MTLLLAVGLAVLVALAVLLVALVWRGSSLLLVPRPYALMPEFTVLGYAEGEVTLPQPRSPRQFADTRREGVYALLWRGGHGRLGAIVRDDAGGVVRPLSIVCGAPPRAGEPARMDNFIYRRDPRQDLQLPFEDVTVESDVGELAGWWLAGGPGSETAVLVVHGRRRGERSETLRALPAVVAAGCGALVLAYRNHRDAPPSPDGLYHYGETEAADVMAGVRFLAERGARRVALFGFSMGAAAGLEAVKRWPPDAPVLTGLVFDSPLVDPAASTVARIENAGMPFPRAWARASLMAAAWRSGVHWPSLDQRRSAERVRVPVLLIAGTRDRTVPIAVVDDFAARLAGPVRYRRVEGADHVEAWNLDPEAYAAWVRDFLTETLGTRAP
ncbi:MAG: alpha/beta fold hydrolase [Deinococcales bacterium]